MTSIKVRLRKSTVKGELCRVVFRLIHQRKVKAVSLPYLVKEDEWSNTKEQIVFSGELPAGRQLELLEIQKDLEIERREIQEIVKTFLGRGASFAVEEVVDVYKKRKKLKSFRFLMEEYIRQKQETCKYAAVHHYRSTLKSFTTFLDGKAVSLQEITCELVWEYIRYLQTCGLKNSTVMFYISVLRRVWNKAAADGLVTASVSPFKGVQLPIERPPKLAVSEEAIKEIENLPVNEVPGHLQLARDLFLFSYFTRGMAFIDIALLKKTDVVKDFLIYKRHKTGQLLHIKILPKIKAIIERYKNTEGIYLFPVLKSGVLNWKEYESALRLQNVRLKKLWGFLRKESRPLSTYVARHSWASIAKMKGIPEEIISNGMGHTSVKTTRIYIARFDNKYVDIANEIVITGRKYQRSVFDWASKL